MLNYHVVVVEGTDIINFLSSVLKKEKLWFNLTTLPNDRWFLTIPQIKGVWLDRILHELRGLKKDQEKRNAQPV